MIEWVGVSGWCIYDTCVIIKVGMVASPFSQACKDGVCVDLSPPHVSHTTLHGKFKGQHYVTWDVKVWLLW